MGFDSSDLAPAATKPPPSIVATVITPPPASPSPASQTAVHLSGAFSMVLEPGADFGPRYRIESLLGEGGMGTVYKVLDKELGRTVALKLVRPEYASSPAAMARFRQELLLASKISHKNILRIHDLGDAGGMKFITMAYVDGQDLGRLMEKGRLPLDRILNFTRQLCSALDAAHSEEVVHRDLKPNNILVDKAENVFVMDFGLAKSFENDATMMTRTGQILGTPRYMAPEQVEAKPVDHRADIYSFGLILYELLAGDIPFRADSAMQLMYQRVTQPAKDIREGNPEVPEYLANIVMRCIAREPEARYQSARQILADLDAQSAPVVRDTAPVGGATIASGMSAIRTTAAGPAVGAQTISIQIPKPTRRGWLGAAGVLIAAVALVFAIPLSRHWAMGLFGGRSAHPGVQHYMAVLPFKVIGDEDTTRYVADGVVDSVSAKLGGLGDVYVASANAVTSAVVVKKDAAKIAKTLGVTLLVQGTVTSSGNEIAITVTLDDVGKSGPGLFHKEFKGPREDLLTMEDNIFAGLVGAMEIKQSAEEMSRTSARPTENIAAYELYLKGENLLRGKKSADADTLKNAVDLFNQASKLDAQFAQAYSGLADAYLKLWDATKDGQWTEKAAGAVRQAEALNDNLPEVHFVAGSIDTATGKTTEAIAELQHALQLAPNSDEALRRLGIALMAANKKPEAVASFVKATEVNPSYWNNFNQLGSGYFGAGDYDNALKAFRRVTELEPDRANGWVNMGVIYTRESRWSDSISMFNKAIAVDPAAASAAQSYSNLGSAMLVLGYYNDAVPKFQRAVELKPNEVMFQRNLADAYRLSGQRDKAMAAYDKAIELAYKTYQVNPQNAANQGQLAICYAKKGDDKQAVKFITQARQIDPNDNALLYKEAVIDAMGGRSSQALANLSQALRKGYSMQEASSDVELKALRETAEYKKLVEDLSRQPAGK